MPGDDVIKIKMPQSPPYDDGTAPAVTDLVWIWDLGTGKLRQAPINTLPFSADGGGSVVTMPSPFMITNTSPQYSYDAGTNSITIEDTRLLNKSQYPVSTTQFGGGDLKLQDITYKAISDDDDTKGAVVISGFALADGEHITITVPGSAGSDDPVYAALLADVAELKKMTAPFKPTGLGPNGGKVWWPSDNDIPDGWQECVAMRGLVPVGQDTGQAEFAAIGASAGAKSVKLVAANIPELSVDLDRPKKIADIDRGRDVSDWSVDDVETVTLTVGTADADMVNVNVMNPYLVGIWIEYVGS